MDKLLVSVEPKDTFKDLKLAQDFFPINNDLSNSIKYPLNSQYGTP